MTKLYTSDGLVVIRADSKQPYDTDSIGGGGGGASLNGFNSGGGGAGGPGIVIVTSW